MGGLPPGHHVRDHARPGPSIGIEASHGRPDARAATQPRMLAISGLNIWESFPVFGMNHRSGPARIRIRSGPRRHSVGRMRVRRGRGRRPGATSSRRWLDASRGAGRSSGRCAAARGSGWRGSRGRSGRPAMFRCTPAWAPTIDLVADLGVVLDPGLAGHDDVVAGLAAPGDPDLPAEQVVAADVVVVADHDEIVDLGPLADPGGLERGSVDRCSSIRSRRRRRSRPCPCGGP